MRTLSILGLFLTSSVLACPNLAGHYKTCRSSNPQESATEIGIEQKIINKVHHFSFTITEDGETRVEKFIADGKAKVITQNDPDTGISLSTTTVTSCTGNFLNIKMNAYFGEDEFANIQIKSSKQNNKLIQVFTGLSMEEQVNETVTCE